MRIYRTNVSTKSLRIIAEKYRKRRVRWKTKDGHVADPI